jgi:riboflavin synthase
MFTGIIEEIGHLARIEDLGGGRRFTLEAAMAPALRPDQSVAVNGVCLTVVQVHGTAFEAVVVEETLSKTTLGTLVEGQPVNLERALQPTGRLDGHFVQGHVDTTGQVVSVEPLATSWRYQVHFDPVFAPYLIPTGAVALDGISLTVARLAEDTLTVAIIPHTHAHTNVRTWHPGTAVNLEFDLIGKYVARILAHRAVLT